MFSINYLYSLMRLIVFNFCASFAVIMLVS
nr:MAG TPA: hypothetical protein [Caudoviricetes sp.]